MHGRIVSTTLGFAFAFSLLQLLTPLQVMAQYDTLPPVIEVTQPPANDTVQTQTPEIRLDYHKDWNCEVPQFPGQPDPCDPDESTLRVWVNGLDKTSQFTKHGYYANTTSVVLPNESWSWSSPGFVDS